MLILLAPVPGPGNPMPRLRLIYRLPGHIPEPNSVLDLILILVFVFLVLALLRSSRTHSPPGPAGLPFFGVALQIPTDKQWLRFHAWITQYGKYKLVPVLSVFLPARHSQASCNGYQRQGHECDRRLKLTSGVR